jgi:hypothetical protein
MDHDVFVMVDGKKVVVGSALQTADGFRLNIGSMVMHQAAPRAFGGPVFPPYGRSKGQPIAGASAQDLAFYASGCERNLDDPAKSRWHEKELALLEAIRAEQARQNHPAQRDEPPPLPTDDVPF